MQKKTQYLREDFANYWHDEDLFSVVQQIQGEIFRQKEGRRTLRFALDGKSFFLKWHQGIGWREIIKNLLQFRLPVISAKNEWQAVRFLERHNIDTLSIAAYGEQGLNPAKKQSFIVTDDLINTMSLEYIGEQWRKTLPSYQTKVSLIKKLALIAKVMHEKGMNHRDFYLCHFLLDDAFSENNTINDDTKLFLIDLHRAQLRSKTPERWIVKDLGGLYFSALDVALTQRDLFRFMSIYSGLTVRETLKGQHGFWVKVEQRAVKLRDE